MEDSSNISVDYKETEKDWDFTAKPKDWLNFLNEESDEESLNDSPQILKKIEEIEKQKELNRVSVAQVGKDGPLQPTQSYDKKPDDGISTKFRELREGWKLYSKSEKTLHDRNQLTGKIGHLLEQDDPLSANLFEDLLSVLSLKAMERMERTICFTGHEGGTLYEQEQVYGYLLGIRDMNELNQAQEITKLKQNQHSSFEDLKKMATHLEGLLKTYGEGAITFKKNLESLATVTAKKNYEPQSSSLSSTSSATGKRVKCMKYRGFPIVMDDDDFKVVISATRYINNGRNIPESYFQIFEYGNRLNEKKLREILYRMEPSLILSLLKGDNKWNIGFKQLATRYFEAYPKDISEAPVIYYEEMK